MKKTFQQLIRKISLCFIAVVITATAWAQQRSINGTVTDETGEPLPGVTAVVPGTTTGTVTNGDGEFSLTIPDDAETLQFSFVGMRTQEVPIEGRTTFTVVMEMDAVGIEEVVAIGYATQIREGVSGSVGTLQGDEIKDQPSIQTSASLMGKVPGVQVTQFSGQPGQNKGTIRIRGIGTLGNSNPLILIDGVSGDIDDVPASDIQNISVLKDASSAAIYGSRGANGVILITTKRGYEGQPMRINYSGLAGIKQPTNQPRFVNGGTFMKMENLGADNLGLSRKWSDDYIQRWEENHENDPDNYPNTNWIDEVFTEQAIQQTHNLNVTGGGTGFRYRSSMQFDDETAQIKNYRFKRYNIRLNTDVDLSEQFSISFDVNALRTDQEQPSSGLYLIMNETYRLPPIYPARYSNGNFASGMGGSRNPAAEAEAGGTSSEQRDIFRGNFIGKFKPIDNLQFSLTYSPVINTMISKNMRKQWKVIDPETQETLSAFPERNSLNERLDHSNQHTLIFTTDYQQKFDDHQFNILGGSEYIDYSSNYFGASRDNFTLQDFEQMNAGSSANQQNFGSATQWRLFSFFGRLDYNYKNKYLLLSNLRYDGSSRFTDQNRWSLFPSVSAAWRISQESFMESVNFINDLKIRSSWGVIGNQNIGNFPFAAVVNLGQNFVFGNQVANGAAQTSLANQEITWEATTTKNIGIDMFLFDSHFDFKFDWFKRSTSDILIQLPMPYILGMNPPYQNAGKVDNTGWELIASYNENFRDDIGFEFGFNISNVKNEVIDLRGAGPFISGHTIIKEGYPINSIYGYVSDGLFQSQEEIDNHAKQTGNIGPGDIKYLDLNDDGLINADDREVIGNSFPSLNYGFNFSFDYKNFFLSAFFQGVGRRDVLLQGATVWAFSNGGRIQPWQIDSYWRPEEPGNEYPRLTRTTSHNNFSTSDFWVYDATYLRLRNLQVGFRLPKHWFESIIHQGRIYFTGENLITMFNKLPPGIDPNVPSGTVGSYFPVNSLYSIGMDITF